MFKRNCVLLFVFLVVAFAFSPLSFAVDKAAKQAILDELSELADKNPEILRSAIYSIADEYSRENKADESIAVFEKALKIFPDNEDFLNRLGNLYNQKQDYTKAAEVYKKITEINPQNVWYFNVLSEAYKNAGDEEKSTAVWSELTKNSDNPDVYTQAANFYNNQGAVDKAIVAVKKALELRPENIEYQRNPESYYINSEKFAEAEEICNEILVSSQNQWDKDWANSELISIYQRQDKLQDLAVRFEKDLSNAPDDLSNYRKLADLHQRSNERDKAIEIYEKAVAQGAADRDINNRLLDLYEGSEKLDKAEKQIKKIMKDNPNETHFYERLANILVRADKVDAAIEQYKKALALEPSNLWLSMRVADILISKGRLKEAKVELNSIIAKTSDEWMKEEAERKILDIDGTPKESAPPAESPAAETPVVEAIEEPEIEVVKPEEPSPKKKKRGWFGR